MGLKESANSAMDAVKRNSPDLTPVANACQGSYNLGRAAVSNLYGFGAAACWKIDETVRVKGVGKVVECVSDSESRKKIAQAISHPITKETLKFFAPGAVVQAHNLIGAVLKNQYHDNKYQQQLEVLQAENEIVKHEIEGLKKELQLIKTNSTTTELKPEKVISLFMLEGLKVRSFVDHQVVPTRSLGKKQES